MDKIATAFATTEQALYATEIVSRCKIVVLGQKLSWLTDKALLAREKNNNVKL